MMPAPRQRGSDFQPLFAYGAETPQETATETIPALKTHQISSIIAKFVT
jgi:hypothetical protein